jgi:hypothetical protein
MWTECTKTDFPTINWKYRTRCIQNVDRMHKKQTFQLLIRNIEPDVFKMWTECTKTDFPTINSKYRIRFIQNVDRMHKKTDFPSINWKYRTRCIQNVDRMHKKQTFQLLKNYQPRFDWNSSRYRSRELQAVMY